jgi:hypothetical protein
MTKSTTTKQMCCELHAFRERIDDFTRRMASPNFKYYCNYLPDDGVYNKNVLRYYTHCRQYEIKPLINIIEKCEKIDIECKNSRSCRSPKHGETPEQFRDNEWMKRTLGKTLSTDKCGNPIVEDILIAIT